MKNASEKERMLSLGELEELARKPSSENWHHLLRGLTDHFLLHADAYADQYGDAFSDVICRILDEVSTESRTELSNRVAPLEQFPSEIVKRLAHDEYAVAAPVLEFSPTLSDSDLIGIAGIVMQDHWLAISRRKQLGARLTDALVKYNDPEVIREMAGNPGAKFSDSTYRVVAEKAKQDTLLQEKLVDRDDLSPTLAIQLNPFLSDELKSKLNSGVVETTTGLLDSLSEITNEKDTPKEQDLANVQVSIQRVKEGKADISEVVTNLADQERFSGVCIFLAGVADLPEKTITSTLLNLNGLPAAVTCKGLGLTQDAFEAISHLRCERLHLPNTELVSQVARYADLNVEDAKKTLAVLQSRKGKDKKGKGNKSAAA